MFSLSLNEEVFYKIAITMNDDCKRKVKHLYFVQIQRLQTCRLKSVDIEQKIASLKCSWVKRLYTETFHEWKIIPLQYTNFLVKTLSFILTLTSWKIPYHIFLSSTKIYWNFGLNIIQINVPYYLQPSSPNICVLIVL